MPKFLIEISHDPEHPGCDRTVADFMSASSKAFAGAQWGCRDDEHKAWLVLDLKDRKKAEEILPEGYKDRAKIIQLGKFLTDEKELRKTHNK